MPSACSTSSSASVVRACPYDQVRAFAEHVRAGDRLRAGRLALLRAHRERVALDLAQLEADLEVIDWKIAAYQAAEDGHGPPPRG